MSDDIFDFVGDRVARHFLDTARAFERIRGPFKAGAMQALEEFWFRSTGKHINWIDVGIEDDPGPNERDRDLAAAVAAAYERAAEACAGMGSAPSAQRAIRSLATQAERDALRERERLARLDEAKEWRATMKFKLPYEFDEWAKQRIAALEKPISQ